MGEQHQHQNLGQPTRDNELARGDYFRCGFDWG